MNIKKAMAVSLAACITLTPMMVKAEKEDAGLITAPISATIEEKAMETEYIHFKGKIAEIEDKEGKFSILVKNDKTDGGLNAMKASVGKDVILLNDKNMDFAGKDELKVGMEVSIYYHKNTPILESLPPILGPDAIVINNKDNEATISVMVSKFNKDLLNAEEGMIIRPSDETIIVDKNGEKVEKEKLGDSNLIVFYDIVLTSYPGQTSPKKIVIMSKDEVEAVEANEFILDKKFIKLVDDVTMIPLRLVGEGLGYKLSWNQETMTTELLKGPQWSALTIGKDSYNFAKMLVELGTAPALIESTTYVPLNFIEKVLVANAEMMENGDIKIVY